MPWRVKSEARTALNATVSGKTEPGGRVGPGRTPPEGGKPGGGGPCWGKLWGLKLVPVPDGAKNPGFKPDCWNWSGPILLAGTLNELNPPWPPTGKLLPWNCLPSVGLTGLLVGLIRTLVPLPWRRPGSIGSTSLILPILVVVVIGLVVVAVMSPLFGFTPFAVRAQQQAMRMQARIVDRYLL